MAEEFESCDLREAVFWGVDLRGATFRDVDLAGARISHARLTDVEIDAEIGSLVVNGVDVTAYVNERDEWFGLRSQLRPDHLASMRRGWDAFRDAWESAIARAERLPAEHRHASVDGEWSFVQTLRHLVFAIDKWFTVPALGGRFHPLGLPNSGSAGLDWPGLDPSADPGAEDAVGAWRGRSDQLRGWLEGVEPEELAAEVDVPENGATAQHDCVGVVFEEHFHHLRYARRDLDRLDPAG